MKIEHPHQADAAARVLAALREQQRRILVCMPLGTGRTKVVELVASELLPHGTPVTVLAQRRGELDQIKHRIREASSSTGAPRLEFKTTGQLIAEGRAGPVDLSDRIVIAINASFSSRLDGRSVLGKVLDSAQAIVAFTSLPTSEEFSVYGDPVYSLDLSTAIRRGILPPLELHSFGKPGLGKNSSEAEIDKALEEVSTHLLYGRSVFVCRDASAVKKIYERLSLVRPVQFTLARMSSDDPAADVDRARNAEWIVADPTTLTGHHIVAVQNVVLLDHFRNLKSFSDAVQSVFGHAGAKVLDYGGNDELWRELLSLNEGASSSAPLGDVQDDPGADGFTRQKWIRPRADGAASEDLMERDRLIHVLRGIIKSKSMERSLAIGVFGRWGSGKSTIINLLKREMSKDQNTVFIEFNAWENEQVSSMPAALADAITQQIYRQQRAVARYWLLAKHRFLLNDTVLGLTFLVLMGLLITLVPIPKLDDKLDFSVLALADSNTRAAASVVLTVFFAMQVAWKSPVGQGIRSMLKQISYAEHIGLARRLRDELTKLFRACQSSPRNLLPPKMRKWLRVDAAKPSTYVLVIDDLDRCSRQNVWSVVEATRLVAEFKEVVLVFAVDYRLLFEAIAERLHDKATGTGERERLSREFLAKILQLSVQLPEPSDAAVARYITKGLFERASATATPDEEVVVAMEGVNEDLSPPSEHDISHVEGPESSEEGLQPLEQMDEYIASTSAQGEIFQECAVVFVMNNPRTLLRLYNSLTLIKGMHPDVGNLEGEYRRHAFYVFLVELCAIQNLSVDSASQFLSGADEATQGVPWVAVREYAVRYRILTVPQRTLNQIAEQRARTTSLPIGAA